MFPPGAALQSQNKGNKEPSVTNYHEYTERPQEYILSLVRSGMPKQTKTSNSNKQAPTAAQSMNHWPPLRNLPVKAPQPHFSRTMSHSGLTTQAHRRRAQNHDLATQTQSRRSVQRMVRPRHCPNSIKRMTLLGIQTSLPARFTITQSSRVLLNVHEMAVSAPLMPLVMGEMGRLAAAPSASLRN